MMVPVSCFSAVRRLLGSVLTAAALVGSLPVGAATAPATMTEPTAASGFELAMAELFAGVETLLAKVNARFDAIRPTQATPRSPTAVPWKPAYEEAQQAISQQRAAADTRAQQPLEALTASVATAAAAQAENDRVYAEKIAASEAAYQRQLAQITSRPVSAFRRVPGGLAGQLAAAQQKVTEEHVAAGAAINGQLQQSVAAVEAQLVDEVTAPAQSVTVAQLSWTIPTVRVSGAPLTVAELAGYELYYTSAATSASGVIVISAADQTAYPLAGLQPGSYFFAISAIDSEGLKSDLSSLVEVHVP